MYDDSEDFEIRYCCDICRRWITEKDWTWLSLSSSSEKIRSFSIGACCQCANDIKKAVVDTVKKIRNEEVKKDVEPNREG